MAKEEFDIGEVFQCGLVKLIVVEAIDSYDLCAGCVFKGDTISNECSHVVLGNCGAGYRKDKTDVIFVKVKE